MNLDGLLQKAKSGDMAAQFELAEYYGKLLKETENEDEIVRYSREAMIWLRKSARQGYGPAVDAVKELDGDSSNDLDAAAAATAAAVASAVESFEDRFSASDTPPEARPLAIGDDADDDDFEPFDGAEPPERRRTGKTALACILIISLLINILVILFLIHIIRDRRNSPTPAPKPTSSATVTASPSPGADSQDGQPGDVTEPDDGQSGDNQGSEGADSTAEPSPTPDVPASPEPTHGGTIPTPTDKPFWIDLDAHPELELKPNQDSLYSEYAYYLVTADNLNVRSGPDTRSTKITNLGLGDKVGAVAKYGNWYLVAVGDKLGWVSGSYLTSNMNWKPESTPAPTNTPTPTQPPVTPTPTPTPTPTQTPVPGGDSSSGDLNVW